MNSPIIYYHEGYASFVPIVLKHNNQYSLNNNKYIISDNKYNHINHIPLELYDKGKYLGVFNEHYRTLCNNNSQYDYLCYKRWYVIYSYMISNNINSLWHLDSDVLLFSDLNVVEKELTDYDAALIVNSEEDKYSSIVDYYQSYINDYETLSPVNIISGHTAYFTVKGLKDLLELGISMFSHSFEICSTYYKKAFVDTGKDGGIDDMHLITNYYLNNKNNIYDLSESQFHFDLLASMIKDKKGNYQSIKVHGIELKKVNHNKIMRNGTVIDVATLHFQYLSKYCMHKYLNYRLDPVTYFHQVSILYFRRTKTFLSKLKKFLLNV